MVIPKIIHYCWFGGNPLPEEAKKCIESWKKYMPGYEIKEWNESNFDINCCAYVKEAYEAKKWAFVSDYARFYIIYKCGGIYFDTDVEVIKSLEPILQEGPFMGLEKSNESYVAPGLGIYKEILDFYNDRHFISEGSIDYTTVVIYVTQILKKHGLKNKKILQKIANINIYPAEYFCPKDYTSGELLITDNTYTIHHFSASWITPKQRIKGKIKRILISFLGIKTTEKIIKFIKNI